MNTIDDGASARRPLILGVVLAAFAAFYLWSYWTYVSLPRPDAQYPLGWWGWFDQGEYLKSVKAFASGALDPQNFLYPPLYPLTGAPFWRISPSHPLLIPDLACYLIYFGSLLVVARRFYGRVLPVLVCVGLMVFLPVLSITQWVIPWTSTLSAALAAVLIALYSRGEDRARPFVLESRADWALFFGFFVAFGAIGPTRPLDIVVWLPFAATYFLRSLIASAKAASPERRWAVTLGGLLAAATGGVAFVALYLGFNLTVFGSAFGAYLKLSGNNGYFPADIPEKLLSLFGDSAIVYGEAGQAFFQKAPILAPAVAICLVTIFTVRDVRRLIVATALINVLLYVPYGDLLPAGLFRFFNLHYFKWSYPWVAVIGAGQLWLWLRKSPGGGRNWGALSASAALLAAGLCTGLRPVEQEDVFDVRKPAERLIRITAAAPRQIDFIDIADIRGGMVEIGGSGHAVKVDGRPMTWPNVRGFPFASGMRLVFQRPVHGQVVEIVTGHPMVSFDGVSGRSTLQAVRFGLSCRLQTCLTAFGAPLQFPAKAGVTRYRFNEPGMIQGLSPSEWWPAEAWGRWSRAKVARVVVQTEPHGAIGVWSDVGVLTGGSRRHGKLSLWVNGCKLAQDEFSTMERRRLGGPLQDRCRRPDGRLQVEWRVDRAESPQSLHISADPRKLGVSVEALIIRNGPV